MDIFAGLETFLYVVSTALFYPVIVVLVLLIFWIAISSGSILREYVERKQGNLSSLSKYKKTLESAIMSSSHTQNDHLDIRLEKLLQESEHDLVKSLDRTRFIVRTGPAIGLMGTLIPMGIALSALAQGDMPQMAGRMVTAFTTTVAGLACGVMAYIMSMVKEKWVRADMREMEYLTELTLRNSTLNQNGPGQNLKSGEDNEIFKENTD